MFRLGRCRRICVDYPAPTLSLGSCARSWNVLSPGTPRSSFLCLPPSWHILNRIAPYLPTAFAYLFTPESLPLLPYPMCSAPASPAVYRVPSRAVFGCVHLLVFWVKSLTSPGRSLYSAHPFISDRITEAFSTLLLSFLCPKRSSLN